jgi:hypothetical protein
VHASGNDELFGGLDVIRCHGPRIIEAVTGGSRLGRGDCPGDVYKEVRLSVLTAHAALLKRFVGSMPKNVVETREAS